MSAQVASLWSLSQRCILDHGHQVQDDLLRIPPSLIVQLFTKGVQLQTKKECRHLEEGLSSLLCVWPKETLDLARVLPDGSHTADPDLDLGQVIIRGLLKLHSRSPLQTVKLTAQFSAHGFLLPILSIVATETLGHKHILDMVRRSWEAKCGLYDHEDAYKGLESVVAWNLQGLIADCLKYTITSHRVVSVWCEWELSLGDWMSLKDAIPALILQPQTPAFSLHFTALKVYNYQTCDAMSFKWLLSLIRLNEVRRLSIFGRRRRSDFVMHEMCEELQCFTNLSMFHMGFLKKSIMVPLPMDSDPDPDDVLANTRKALLSWPSLNMLHFLGARMSGILGHWLSSLHNPLSMLYLNYCYLKPEDLECLATSHHTMSVVELGLEGNDCRGQGEVIVRIVSQASRLQLLNLRETHLKLHEKLEVLLALAASAPDVHTVAMYEQEDMLSTEGYEQVIYAACLLPKLTKFYIFPFDYKPFEMFFRETVRESCDEILTANNKVTKLKLFY